MRNHLIALTFCRLDQLTLHQPGRGRGAPLETIGAQGRPEGGVPRRWPPPYPRAPASVLYGPSRVFQRGLKGALSPGVRVTLRAPQANAVRLAPGVRA